MNVDSRQLALFVAIVEAGSFRKAAERIGIAQPALTVSIKRLEAVVGAEVFVRGARGVSLTPAGASLLVTAQRVLSIISEGVASALQTSLGRSGPLRLGFVGSAAYTLLPRLLPKFRAAFPQVRVELIEGSTIALLEQLRQRQLDTLLIREPIVLSEELVLRPGETDELIAAVPASHRLGKRKSIALSDLRNDPFVGFSPESVPGMDAMVTQACAAAGFLPRIEQRANRVQTVVSLIACEVGVALIPSAAAALPHKNVAYVRLSSKAAPPILLSAARLRDNAPPQAALFMDMIALKSASAR